ncbi:MAG TPA: YsnF/AvaK domain-containing protein [Chitinophagaceae bacterium]|jgi:uncharacterized protein (TIGR02271 family)|nr:YsnF/AvaK domain-containing protein [Chitinophagaceae bacterium]
MNEAQDRDKDFRSDETARTDGFEQRIPVIEEQLHVDKKVVETGKVTISRSYQEQETLVQMPLAEEHYEVERVPVNERVSVPPPPVIYEGDLMIIPVVREVLVVQKQYEVVEEIRIRKRRTETIYSEPVTLRKEEVRVERTDLGSGLADNLPGGGTEQDF